MLRRENLRPARARPAPDEYSLRDAATLAKLEQARKGRPRPVSDIDRRECLSRVIPLGERHLRVLVAEYVEHYNLERNRQSIGNQLIGAAPMTPANGVGGVVRRSERLGGLLSFYHRGAA